MFNKTNGFFEEINGNKYLKELRNYKRKFFLCPPQKQAEMQPAF